jgi:hypothetical protein
MSLARTRQNFLDILADPANRVVALSGKWGTGKSHLWKEVQAASTDKQVKTAVYVSLFGLSSLSELRLKVAQGVLPKLEAGSQVAESIKNGYAGVKKVLKSIHSGFSALDELALIATPMMLKGRFIVIDDIERKHDKLSIDEILGFIDDCVQSMECRILLILNSDQLGDKKLWELFREKVIDQEIRLDTSPNEAFDIAVKLTPTTYVPHIKPAVEACNLTNIRIIRKIIRVVNRLLASRGHLSDQVLSRVVPSATLLSAIHYKGLDEGPDFDFVLGYESSLVALMKKNDAKRRGEEDTPEMKARERWRLLLEKLGIQGTDSFEALVVDYLKSGLIDLTEVDKIIDRYVSEAEALDARKRRFDFFDKVIWHPEISEPELLEDLRRLVPEAALHDMYSITALHDEAMKLPNGQPVARELIDRWLAAFRARLAAGEERGFDPDFHFFHQPVHPEINREVRGLQARHNASTSLPEVCRKVAEKHSWGSREEAFMKSVTPADYEAAILAARGEGLKLLLLQSMDFVKNRSAYETSFGGALDAFIAACRSLSQRQDIDARWKSLIRNLFRDAGREEDLSTVVRPPGVGDIVAAQATDAEGAAAAEGATN